MGVGVRAGVEVGSASASYLSSCAVYTQLETKKNYTKSVL